MRRTAVLCVTIALILVIVEYVYGVYTPGQLNQQRVDQLKSYSGTDDTAKGFNAKWGSKLAGPGNIFNSSVLDLYDVHVDNATLAQIIESGARTADGSVWGTVKYVADNLKTPQYIPKTAREAAAFSKLIMGVDDITSYPKELKGFAHKSWIIIDDMGGVSVSNEKAVWGGINHVVGYITDCLNKKLFNLDKLYGDDLERAIMPLALDSMGIVDGKQYVPNVKMFVNNTTSWMDGQSPLQWQGKVLNQIKTEKGERYIHALKLGNETLAWGGWPDAVDAYMVGIANLPDKNDIFFVYGVGGLTWRPSELGGEIVDVKGAHQPDYATIVGMHFGMPLKVRSANYPTLGDTYHDDHSVWGSDGKYHGPFMYPEEMAKSYVGTSTKMKLSEGTNDGTAIIIVG